ncbi:hypothetical protein GALL_181280 [mine drainage metagenome]|uniref:AlgX/AlgJ SGNH hydrolase-like domain-containing protein n=1 Tax=mine drainage metagenome TaxID=410659 RepID=A0A1J5SDG1_9ZZZZ
MKHAKYFSISIFIVLLSYGAIAFYFLPLTTFQGDLTRMSLLPESLFGWTKPQPALDAKWLQQATMREADVLVIGDSFSDGHIWQSVLMQHGLKVRTEVWGNIQAICADFMPWLRTQGFRGKYLVIESVERNLVDILDRSVACQHIQYHPNSRTDVPRTSPIVSFDVHQNNYTGKLSTGIKTQLNVLKYAHLSHSPDFKNWLLSNDVRMVRVPDGCKLFSHANCNDALFLSYDKPEDINTSALENIGKLNARLEGVTPIWVFVPNKSTAYLYPGKQFWNEAEQRFHAPNLLRIARQAIRAKTVDLYLGNNTHFSTTGYLLMGEAVFKAMQPQKPEHH